MSRRNLLICFDAFGTLFKPRRPVPQQYGEVARALGLDSLTDGAIESSFKTAFKEQSKQNPNFGKANGMNAEKWWTNVITNTFQPLVGKQQLLPSELVPRLLHRFWSDEGYMLVDGVRSLLRKLRRAYQADAGKLVVGVITNSDDRVPDILSSLGVRVSPLRYGSQPRQQNSPDNDCDFEFAVMSYDVGHEKPDKRIFAAAEEMLETVLRAQRPSMQPDRESWQKVYVGDEYSKDVVGALGAGWNAVLVESHDGHQHSVVRWVDEHPPENLQAAFDTTNAIGFDSLGKFEAWLPD